MAVSELRALALKPSTVEHGYQQGPARGLGDARRDGGVDRRQARSGKLGNRRTDNWMPYSTAFVAQLLAQQMDEQLKAQASGPGAV